MAAICNGQEELHHHAAVLLAAPAYHVAQMRLEADTPVDFSSLKEIVHPPVARIVMGFRRKDVVHPLNGFGFLVPQAERLKILGTTFSSSIFPNRAPADHVLLTTFIGGCRQPEVANHPANNACDLVLRDLQRVLGARARPTFVNHVLFPRAIPQYNTGYKKFADAMNAIEARLPGLYLAGSYRDGISVANCIVSGHGVAERIAQFMAQSSPRPVAQAFSP